MAKPALHLLSALLLTTLLAACSKALVEPTHSPVVSGDSTSAIHSVCLNGYLPHQPGMQQHPLYVIRTQSEYEAVQAGLRDSASICADTTLPVIDFTRSTLLGKHTTGSGCRLEVPASRMSISRDTATRTVTWTIVHIEHGRCEPLRYNMSWVVVPAIDARDSVVVVVETEVVE